MSMPSPSSRKARVIHRYLGFFLAGIMAIYAISGVVLIFRNTDFLKVEEHFDRTLPANLSAEDLGREIGDKRLKFERTEGETVYFKNGTYNLASGRAEYMTKELPLVLKKMTHLHKSNTDDPLFFLNIFFGGALLFFVISAFWMYLPGGPILRKGLWFTAAGVVLTLILLLV